METFVWIKDGDPEQRVLLPRHVEETRTLSDGSGCLVRVRTAALLARPDGYAALDALGYNRAVPLEREPYTTYGTEWVKDADHIYREVVIVAEVDEGAKTAALAGEVRDLRDLRLALSDWTQLADCPLDETEKAAWAAYRQELRDIPQQVGFPEFVSWPAIPEA
jgi:hypothetical protein